MLGCKYKVRCLKSKINICNNDAGDDKGKNDELHQTQTLNDVLCTWVSGQLGYTADMDATN